MALRSKNKKATKVTPSGHISPSWLLIFLFLSYVFYETLNFMSRTTSLYENFWCRVKLMEQKVPRFPVTDIDETLMADGL